MADTIVQLGDVQFRDFEIPEEIPFGGSQSLAVHKLIGGKRIIDAMGADDEPLSWSGRFRGSQAVARARQLDAMRRSGRAFALTWGELAYTVVIQRFVPKYQAAYEIPYEITCEVQSYDVDPAPTAQLIGVDDMVDGDMLSADAVLVPGYSPVLDQQMDSVEYSLSLIKSVATASRSVLNTVLQPLADARNTVSGLEIMTADAIGAFGQAGPLVPGLPMPTLVSRLQDQIVNMTASANLYEMDGYLGRVQRNLEAVGASGAEQRMVGGNLYALALGAYGDATEWSTIAQANGLSDPFLTGIQTLLVPPSPSGLGGVPNI